MKNNPYRLDKIIEPVLYDLSIEPNLDQFVFSAEESVEFHLSQSARKLTWHAADLKIHSATVFHRSSKKIFFAARKITTNEKFETVTFEFDKPIPPGKNYTMKVSFEGELNDKMHGFYRTSYFVNGQKRWGAATQFEATDARRAFVCIDEPDAKARFRATLKVPTHLTALSNMPIIEEKADQRTGKKTLRYDVTPKMSTYLLCFVVAELEDVETRDDNGVLIRVWTTPGKKKQGQFALDVAKHGLEYFADWFGIPYALPKMDMVALPDFSSGAMENWGLVTYRETALLVDEANSSAQAKQRVAEVIDHELAHQWFGNLVTMEWWTDLWLNEGFASYMGPKAVDDKFPEWKLWDQYVSAELLTALHDDALKNSHPIEIDVKDPSEIREIFDHITYNKGSAVNRMLEHYLGEKKFRAGLRKYLKKYAYGNARTVDLWKVLEEVSGQPVRQIMEGFTRQEGFPLINAQMSASSGKTSIALTQRRFIFDGSADPKKAQWKVPITVSVWPSAENQAYLLKAQKGSFVLNKPVGKGSVKLNPGQTGFYRVRYSPDMMKSLLSAVRANGMGVADTLGLLDDAFSLVRSGDMSAPEILEVLPFFSNRAEYNIWVTISGIFGSLENLLDSEEDQRSLHRLASASMRSLWTGLGWLPKKTDSHSQLLLRSMVIGRLGHFGDAEVIAKANELFQAHSSGGDLDPNIRGAVYGIASEHGGADVWQKLKQLYEKTELQEEKVRILRALTRFRDVAVAGDVLEYALSGQVRPQDTYVILAGFGSNGKIRHRSWQFIRERWQTISGLYKSGSVGLLGHILEGACGGFSEIADLKETESFFKTNPVAGTERTCRQTLELVRSNIAWKKRDQQRLSKFLGQHNAARVAGSAL